MSAARARCRQRRSGLGEPGEPVTRPPVASIDRLTHEDPVVSAVAVEIDDELESWGDSERRRVFERRLTPSAERDARDSYSATFAVEVSATRSV